MSSLKVEDAINVSTWFEETSVVNFGDVTFEYLISRSLPLMNFEDPNEYDQFIHYLKAIDVGIEGIRLEKVPYSSSISDEDTEDDTDEDHTRYKIYTQHRNIETHQLEEVPLYEESSGTLKMISLYYFLYDTLQNGCTLFVDEMDAKLHPLLTRYIISLFQDSETNPNDAQLIFTTHDTNALSNELFRRDQIWFVEKSTEGISSLYSLAEYKVNHAKVRKDASYNKNYLSGRYGAVPNLTKSKVGD